MALALVLVLGLLTTFIALTRPRIGVIFGCILLPWQGLDMDVGLRVTAPLLFWVPLTLRTLWDFVFRPADRFSLSSNALIPYVAFSLAVSFIALFTLPDQAIYGGSLRSPYARALIQLVIFVVICCPAIAIPLYLRDPTDADRLVKLYVSSLSILAVLGWAQMILWSYFGVNPFPVGALDLLFETQGAAAVREGQFYFEGVTVNRMNSLGGEPKNLGAALVFGLALLIYAYEKAILPTNRIIFTALLFLSAIWATYSTAAYYLVAIGFMTYFLVGFFFRRVRIDSLARSLGRSLPFFFVLIVIFGAAQILLSSQFGNSGVGILDMLQLRTIDRDQGVLEDFDGAILTFLSENPIALLIGAGLGNVHLFADEYLPSVVASYASGGVFVAKAAYLKIASETGVIGLLFFILTIGHITLSRSRLGASEKNGFSSLQMLLAITAMMYLAVTYGPEIYFVLGIAFLYLDKSHILHREAVLGLRHA